MARLFGQPMPISSAFSTRNRSVLALWSGRRVAGAGGCRGTFGNHVVVAQLLARCVAPQVGAHAVVQAFGKGFGQAVGQALEHDGGVIVQRVDERLFLLLHTQPGGDGEQARASVVGNAAFRAPQSRPGSGWGGSRRRWLFSVCWRRPYQVMATSVRVSSV